ncbi:MAG: gliding motility-associated C-terminal domain-containing protein [Elusimicrobiota bacterium]|nr:gliding motility-associated C-terminal domain-containing protein [Elusimicrobiota bacterium]
MPFLKAAIFILSVCAAAVAPGAAPLAFDFAGPTNRVITPNGDTFNDSVTFRFVNPKESSGFIRIYDLRGRELHSLPVSVGDAFKTWDARVNGQVVNAGVYIYVLSIERRTYSGALLVVR